MQHSHMIRAALTSHKQKHQIAKVMLDVKRILDNARSIFSSSRTSMQSGSGSFIL